jgi:predicted small integral membrane protein
MGRILKAVLVLAVAAFLGLVGYAYLGDIAPEQVPVSKPVVLDGQ